jgi:hypothetical protein
MCWIVFIVLIITALFVPYRNPYYSYKEIGGSKSFGIPAEDFESNRKFIERDGDIYMKVNTLRRAWILVTEVKEEEWNKENVKIINKLVASCTKNNPTSQP